MESLCIAQGYPHSPDILDSLFESAAVGLMHAPAPKPCRRLAPASTPAPSPPLSVLLIPSLDPCFSPTSAQPNPYYNLHFVALDTSPVPIPTLDLTGKQSTHTLSWSVIGSSASEGAHHLLCMCHLNGGCRHTERWRRQRKPHAPLESA